MHDLDLREYVHLLGRRNWIVLQAVVIIPVAGVALALRVAAVPGIRRRPAPVSDPGFAPERHHQQLDTTLITNAVNGLERRIAQLRTQTMGSAQSLEAGLRTKIDQLQTLLTLENSNAVVVRATSNATKIRP